MPDGLERDFKQKFTLRLRIRCIRIPVCFVLELKKQCHIGTLCHPLKANTLPEALLICMSRVKDSR